MSTEAINHFPVFPEQPDDDFIAGWSSHIMDTGYPETYTDVSTSKPTSGDNLIFLSGDLQVPVKKRLDGRRVPCPYCSGLHPKFEWGRMAYFPEEMAVRFIGRQCAQTHNPEGYSRADRHYRAQETCRRHIREWPEHQNRRPVFLDFLEKLRPVAADLQYVRDQLDLAVLGFGSHLQRELAQSGGELFITQNLGMKDRHGNAVIQKRSLGRLSGLSLFAERFEPKLDVQKLNEILNDIMRPLPDWQPTTQENEATREIVRRGKKVDGMPARLSQLWLALRDAQAFFDATNLRSLVRWATAPGNGAFDRFELERKENQLLLRATSFRGKFYANVMLPETLFTPLPNENELSRDNEEASSVEKSQDAA